jgi:hypothetical protein
MLFRVILERDGIFRSVEFDRWIGLVKARADDQVFMVEASGTRDAIKKAGALWKPPEQEEPMAKKKTKPKKKRKKKSVSMGY